jgi:hypothetical protein
MTMKTRLKEQGYAFEAGKIVKSLNNTPNPK